MATLDSFVPTTKLDAVNIMLFTIGEQPVSSLAESGLSDVAIAKVVLAEISREVQSMGWNFNSDYEVELARDINNKIPVPGSAMRIDPSDTAKDYVDRGGFLWDRYNKQFTFTENVKADIVYLYDFEDIPETARYYIAIRAARIFQKRMLGDDSVEVFTEKEEQRAKANLEDAHGDSRDSNMLQEAELYGTVRGGRDRLAPFGM